MATKEAIEQPLNMSVFFSPIRNAIFGKQNERIEYLMDSFFKLTIEQRIAVVAGGVFAFLLFIVCIIWFYLSALSQLQTDLDQAFSASNALKEVQTNFQISKQHFSELENIIQVNQNLSLISLIENKAKEMNITVADFPSQQEVSSVMSPLNSTALKNHQIASVSFSISKTGLKKIVEFIISLESLPNKIKVSSLTIKRGFTDKLYLDASVKVEAILPPAH